MGLIARDRTLGNASILVIAGEVHLHRGVT